MASSAVLQSEGKVIAAPKEGESAPSIIEELNALFPNPQKISFSDLETLATKVLILNSS